MKEALSAVVNGRLKINTWKWNVADLRIYFMINLCLVLAEQFSFKGNCKIKDTNHLVFCKTCCLLVDFKLENVLLLQIEHLKSCLEVASTRTINWQKFCQKDESNNINLPLMHCIFAYWIWGSKRGFQEFCCWWRRHLAFAIADQQFKW